jgi:L-seryl-tRNA(Ser) seleniumtransferase
MDDLRRLPSVEHILQSAAGNHWLAEYGRPLTLEAIRTTFDEARSQFSDQSSLPDLAELEQRIAATLGRWTSASLLPVINATGVILHTNLGRAPLSASTLQAVQAVSLGYSNLEFDLENGRRGSRLVHAEALLTRLTGAEAALVVNNNAAAVLLVLSTLARRRAVVIARSQLVEIGGGFRVPDVLKQSGARLAEVGTTNRVNLADYKQAIQDENAAMVLWTHRSNFRIIGFTSEPTLAEIATAAREAGVLMVDDLGSGALLDTAVFGLGHEPTVQESLRSGVDLVCFSGDKLLGGPQAGIILGRRSLVERLKRHPLARAIRADKLCLAALSATLGHYLKDEAVEQIPLWRMIAASAESIHQRAESWANELGMGQVIPGQSTVGGGSLPEETLPTYVLALALSKPALAAANLRRQTPHIIARLEDDRLLLDARTVLPEQEPALLHGLRQAIHPS